MGIYHLGALSCLRQHAPKALFDPRKTSLLGASAGSLLSLAIVSELHTDDLSGIIFSLAEAARRQKWGVLTPGFCLLTGAYTISCACLA